MLTLSLMVVLSDCWPHCYCYSCVIVIIDIVGYCCICWQSCYLWLLLVNQLMLVYCVIDLLVIVWYCWYWLLPLLLCWAHCSIDGGDLIWYLLKPMLYDLVCLLLFNCWTVLLLMTGICTLLLLLRLFIDPLFCYEPIDGDTLLMTLLILLIHLFTLWLLIDLLLCIIDTFVIVIVGLVIRWWYCWLLLLVLLLFYIRYCVCYWFWLLLFLLLFVVLLLFVIYYLIVILLLFGYSVVVIIVLGGTLDC